MRRFSTFEEARRFLYSISADFHTNSAFKYGRVRHFAKLCGDPQNSYPSVHVAGTSGKGSTSWILANLLIAHGYRVGLRVSPHVLDYRERVMIDATIMDDERFLDHLDAFLPLAEAMARSPFGQASYSEFAAMFAFETFRRERVDIAVAEVDCGGLQDSTNILDRPDTIRVIADLGYDHVEWLGNTLKEIAYQKAGIIHRGDRVLSLRKEPEAQDVIDAVCADMAADGHFPEASEAFTIRNSDDSGVRFDVHDGTLGADGLLCAMRGRHQARNAYLAIRAAYEVCTRDGRTFDWGIVRDTLASLRMPGRYDRSAFGRHTLVLDAAHNVQKMTAFMEDARHEAPKERLDALVGFKEGKDFENMLARIVPHVSSLAIGSFDVGSDSIRANNLETIAAAARALAPDLPIRIVADVRGFLEEYRDRESSEPRTLLATGSLYFVSVLYPVLREMGVRTES